MKQTIEERIHQVTLKVVGQSGSDYDWNGIKSPKYSQDSYAYQYVQFPCSKRHNIEGCILFAWLRSKLVQKVKRSQKEFPSTCKSFSPSAGLVWSGPFQFPNAGIFLLHTLGTPPLPPSKSDKTHFVIKIVVLCLGALAGPRENPLKGTLPQGVL